MDFIIGLPPSKEYIVVFIVVYCLSKYARFHALPTSFTTTKVVVVFVDIVCHLHKIPKTIAFYCDMIFISNFWHELFRLSGTKRQLVIPPIN